MAITPLSPLPVSFVDEGPTRGRGRRIAANGRKVELLIRCTELADLDTFSKTDPLCVIFVRKFGQWKEFGRTEAQENTLNPTFTGTFILDYEADLHQPLLFSVYDIDNRSHDLRKHDFVGSKETTLDELLKGETTIATTTHTLWAPGSDKPRGLVHITAEVLQPCRGKIMFHLGASNLDKKGLFSMTKTDVYLEVSRGINSVDFHPVYRSEVLFKTQNPRWRPFELTIQTLCNGNPERRLQLSCWRITADNERKLLGRAVTSVDFITKQRKNKWELPLRVPKKESKKSYKGSGEIRVFNCRLEMDYTLLDYVRGGCSLRLMAAIDFTSSNGDIDEPTSLHYLEGNTVTKSKDAFRLTYWHRRAMDNEYIEAIKTVGSMLGYYDQEQRMKTYGFGARLTPEEPVNHAFDLSPDKDRSQVKGIQGLIEAYRERAGRLTFAGPSCLAPVIRRAIRHIKRDKPTQKEQFYYVLMIITDGVVNDLDDCLQAIREANRHPLSISIVGIGPADFHIMEQLKFMVSEQPKSSHSTKEPYRDCVHFTALRRHHYNTGAHTALAKETLARVSQQFREYMKRAELVPNPPSQRVSSNGGVNGWVESGEDFVDGADYPPDIDSDIFSPTVCNHTDPQCPTCGAPIQANTGDRVTDMSLHV